MTAPVFLEGPSEPLGPLDVDGLDLVAPVPSGDGADRLIRRAIATVGLVVALVTPLLAQADGVRWPEALTPALLLSAVLAVWATATLKLGPGTWNRVAALDVPGPIQKRRSFGLGRRPDVFIVGDHDFCAEASAAAADSGRRVAGHWPLDAAAGGPAPVLSPSHEVIVQARFFAELRDRAPEAFDGTTRVTVAAGDAHHRVLSGPLGPVPRAFKRALDISFALAGLVLCAPSVLLAMLAIRIDSRGPAIFKQQRVGAGGRRFTLYKLRTMTTGEEDPAVLAYMADMVRCQAPPENGLFKLGSNRRITRIGRILRRFSIDEAPQLVNVLKGDMSLVGPRPCILEEAACYNEFHWQRLAVRPGITGLAQVNGRSRLRFDDIVTLDVRYSRCWSPLLELKILMRTPAAVLSGRGAT